MYKITVAAAEIGKAYKLTACGANPLLTDEAKEYDVTIKTRSATHTYVTHKHGEIALPNNISIDLIALHETKTIS